MPHALRPNVLVDGAVISGRSPTSVTAPGEITRTTSARIACAVRDDDVRQHRPSPASSPARCGLALAWSVGAMEQVFLSDLFPGIIGFGRVHCVHYSVVVTGWHGFP
jgi:hypothetical protein